VHAFQIGFIKFVLQTGFARIGKRVGNAFVVFKKAQDAGNQGFVGAVSAVGFGKAAVQTEAHFRKRRAGDRRCNSAQACGTRRVRT